MHKELLKRSYTDVMALRKKAAEEELARAQAPGGPVRVSRMAAAIFCNVSYDTMRRWEQDGTGPRVDANSQEKGREWVFYIYQDLVDWVARGAMKPTQRKKAAKHANAIRDELEHQEELRRERELELMRQETRKLEKELEVLRKKTQALGFTSLQDLRVEQDWVMRDSQVVGHVLTVTDAELQDAIDRDDIWEATLDEALMVPWVSLSFRRFYFRNYYLHSVLGTDNAIEASVEQQSLREAVPVATRGARGRKKTL